MKSVDLIQMEAIAAEIDSGLLATNPGFGHYVYAVMDDGSSFLFNNAFVQEQDGWYMIFPEHYDPFTRGAEDFVTLVELEGKPSMQLKKALHPTAQRGIVRKYK